MGSACECEWERARELLGSEWGEDDRFESEYNEVGVGYRSVKTGVERELTE